MNRSIAPIFNITKRPRQALVSDPCDSQSMINSKANENMTRLAPPSVQPELRQSPQALSKPWNQGKNNPSHMGLLPPKPSLPQYHCQRSTGQSFQRAGGPQLPQKQTYSRGAYSASNTSRFNGPRGQSPQSFPQSTLQKGHMFNQNKANMNTQSHGTNQRGFSGTNPRNVPQKRGFQQVNHEASGSFLSQQSHVEQSPVQHANKQVIPPQQQFNTQAYNRRQVQMQQGGFNKCNPEPSTSRGALPVTKQKQTGGTKETDKTLRVMTATINAVKQWGTSTHTVPVMFEVHGIINSAITFSRWTDGKEFLLKDETGIVPCIFFEIDRQLGRLTRGQWHRCMGTYDCKMEKFKCVSARVSNPAERSLAKVSVKQSEQALSQLIRDLREA